MDWVTALFALIPTILLLAQGTSCLRRSGAPLYVRRFGFLCCVLSGLSFVLCLLLASGTLVLSSEFGLVMVQGSLARFGIGVLLMGSAFGAGMGLHVCYLEAGRRTRLWWLLGPGFLVGSLASGRLLPLNTGDAEPFRIYAYDLWWPPLLICLSACLVESALSILRLHHRPVRLWVATALIAGLALLALSQPQLGDPTSAVLWKIYLVFLLPTSISLVTWLFFRIPRQRLTRVQWWTRRGLTVLPSGIALLSSVCWVWGLTCPDGSTYTVDAWTNERGRFSGTFSLDPRQRMHKPEKSGAKGRNGRSVYAFQAHILYAAQIAPTDSNIVFWQKTGDDGKGLDQAQDRELQVEPTLARSAMMRRVRPLKEARP